MELKFNLKLSGETIGVHWNEMNEWMNEWMNQWSGLIDWLIDAMILFIFLVLDWMNSNEF